MTAYRRMRDSAAVLEEMITGSRKVAVLLVILVIGFGACRNPSDSDSSSERSDSQSAEAVGSRQKKVERRLASSSSFESRNLTKEGDAYVVNLLRGQATDLSIEQKGADVVIEAFDPTGRRVLDVDSPIGKYGREHVCLIAEGPGGYKVRVRPFRERTEGGYVIRAGTPHAVSFADRACVAATREWAEAENRWLAAEKGGHLGVEVVRGYESTYQAWRLSGRRFQEGYSLGQLGRRWFEIGYVARAVRCYEQAIHLLRSLGDLRQEAILLGLLGSSQRLLGEVPEAETNLQAALQLARRLGDRRIEATALNNLALLARNRGEVDRAISDYRRALSLYESLGELAAKGVVLHNLGVSFTFQGRYAEALDVLEEALLIQQSLDRSAEQVQSMTAIGWVHHLSGDDETAIRRLREAIAFSRHTGRRPEEAAALDRLATTYRESGDLAAALQAYREALVITRKLENPRDYANILTNVGLLLAETGQTRAAERALASSLHLFRRLGDQEGLAYTLAGLARAESRLGALTAARSHLEEALEIVNDLRSLELQSGGEPRPDAFWEDYTGQYVDLLMEFHSKDPAGGHARRAFEVADLAHSRALVTILNETNIGRRSGVPLGLLERERTLRERLEGLYQRRSALMTSEEPPTEELKTVEDALQKAEAENAEIQRAIRTSSPRFSELRDPQPLSLGQVQRLLAPSTALMSYFLGRKRSFLFIVERRSFSSYVLPDRGQIEAVSKAVYEAVKVRRPVDRAAQLTLVTARLGQILLRHLPPSNSTKRLLIVPDGMLHYIPFAVLPPPGLTPPEDTDRGRGLATLLDSYEIGYLPSAAALMAIRQRRESREPSRSKCLAVVADPVYSAADDRLRRVSGARIGGKCAVSPLGTGTVLQRLRFSGQEGEAILSMVSPDRRLPNFGFSANLRLVRSGALARCSILHFAAHATVDEDHPELSGIVFSLVDNQGRPVDGHLRVLETYTLNLPAELVVLSACSSALGRQVRGNGMVGMTRGFLYAGASGLLVSLWNVDDEATSALMARFYQGLLTGGLTPSTALRQAQQWLRTHEVWRSPYYWAPFILQGDPRLD